MTLGENIVRLRTQKNWSQGDLADALEISRQSVSKWETDASIPELDKLLKLSELFGVTLDELVRGEDVPKTEPVPASFAPQATPEREKRRTIAGTVLLCTGAVILVFCLLLAGDLLTGLLFASPFLICGIICFAVKQRTGLYCGWAVYLCVDFYLRFAIGVSWTTIFMTHLWTYEMNYTEGLPPASDGVPKRSCAPQGFQRSVTEAMYDYFYGAEAEQFFFYRIPKVLFTEERFRSVSAEAKVLYGLLLDRMSLSCKNGWLDKEGRVYIIFTIEEVMTALGCADQKAGKLLHELESKCRLIERKRQGLGKPNLIYVKNFVENHVDNASGSTAPSPESRFQNRENHDSGAVKITDQESLKSRSNNTDKNDTDFSDTDSFPFTSFRRDHGREAKGNEAALRERYRELIAENIAYDTLLTDYGGT